VNHRRVHCCVPADEILHPSARHPQVGRVQLDPLHGAVGDHPHHGGRGGGELVQPVGTVEDQAPVAASGEHAGHQLSHPGVSDPDGLRLRLSRVGQWTQEVEGGGDPQLAPRC
jgi:hypothetical protein